MQMVLINSLILGKGKGLFALEDSPAGTFICEYKTTGAYTRKEYSREEFEYKLNEEKCACVDVKIDGKMLYFDDTRRINQDEGGPGCYNKYGRPPLPGLDSILEDVVGKLHSFLPPKEQI